MELSDFFYDLPKELIAQEAVEPKDHSRLLVVHKENNKHNSNNNYSDRGSESNIKLEHKHFYDIVDYLKPGDLMVLNETKVSKARLCGTKKSGSPIELILTQRFNETDYECRIKGNRIHKGSIYLFNDGLTCEVIDMNVDIFKVRFNKPITDDMVEKLCELPTPPYVKKKLAKDSQYQTVYAKTTGSLAAPTAGLHFTPGLLAKIEKKGIKIVKVCLHVGFGTFLGVKGKIEEHKMHSEEFEITNETADAINNRKGRLVVVGTTTVRTLESAADSHGKIKAMKGATDIFIYPGYKFKNNFDVMITNFHLPESTLLLLVSAFFGREEIMATYREAVKQKYRFYSLGDSMVLIKNK